MTYQEWLEELARVRNEKKDTKEHHDVHKQHVDAERELIKYYHKNLDRFLEEQLDKGE